MNDMRSDYNAARASRYRRRRKGIALGGSSADFHYRSEADYLRLIEEARDFDRNDVVVGQTVDRAVSNEIQDGFSVDPQTTDKALDEDLYQLWQAWGTDPELCDAAGELSFHQMEELVDRQVKVDGDMFVLPSEEGSLQLVEGHRCRTPGGTKRNVIHGVLLDELRRRVEFWFTKDDIDPLTPLKHVNQVARYPARDADGNRQVFHVYHPKRVSQTRGVTAFAPIFDEMGMFEDTQFAALLKSQISACYAVFRERELKTGDIPSTPPQLGERTTETRRDGSTRTIENIHPGMIIEGAPGEKLQGFSPNVPNPEFFEHMRLVLTLIGINLGLPLVLVLLDPRETNFSSWRGAMDQARMGFRRNQRALISRFHTPVWKWKVRQWIAEDPAIAAAAQRLGNKIFAHRWNTPRWPYIEPLTDRQAELLAVTGNLTSRRRVCEESNLEWELLADEIIADNAYAIRNAKREAAAINEQYKDDNPVHWRELISLPMPSGMNVALDNQKDRTDGDGQKRPKRDGTQAA